MILLILILLAGLAGGCATTTTPPAVVDTFCLSPASKKRKWNPETDTVERMREAVVFNRYVDARCNSKRTGGRPPLTRRPLSG